MPPEGLISVDLVDRISLLPDEIIGVILSFLVTKEAVTTSLLSKRWKFAWVSVHNLDFRFYNRSANKKVVNDGPLKFIDFVNHVLHLHGSSLLNKFNFVWCPKLISSSCFDTWINTAISKNVCDLSLRCVGPCEPFKFDSHLVRMCVEREESYFIPINVLCCDSLYSLELSGLACIISIYDETTICLPKLESLKMSRVSFKSKKACDMILSGCPILKFLDLNIENGDFELTRSCDFECTISSDKLVHLKLNFEGDCSFKLRKAPALEYLMLNGCISEISIDTSLASLVEADFNVMLYNCRNKNSIVEVVRAFHSVKVLTLSFDAVRALANATINLSTEFKRLVKLVVGTCSSIQDFIHNSENLEALIIQKDDPNNYFNYYSKRSGLGEVPRCLSNSLKEVQINNYTGLEDEIEMIQFIIQHGSVLEILKISCTQYKYYYGDQVI